MGGYINREREELIAVLRGRSDREMAYLFWYVFGWMSRTKCWDNFRECVLNALATQIGSKLRSDIEQILEDESF